VSRFSTICCYELFSPTLKQFGPCEIASLAVIACWRARLSLKTLCGKSAQSAHPPSSTKWCASIVIFYQLLAQRFSSTCGMLFMCVSSPRKCSRLLVLRPAEAKMYRRRSTRSAAWLYLLK
jgi:hypothetical protein